MLGGNEIVEIFNRKKKRKSKFKLKRDGVIYRKVPSFDYLFT